MTAAGRNGPGGDDLDRLRRRVYGPGATAEDVRRYEEAAVLVQSAPEDAPPTTPGARTAARLRRRTAVGVLGGAAVVAVVGAIVARPVPARTGGAGPVAIAVPATVAAGFVHDLRVGRTTELGSYLVAHPDLLPAALRRATDPEVHQLAGFGSGAVQLRPSLAVDAGGMLTVVVVTDDDAPVDWRATRDIRDLGGLARFRTVGRSAGRVTAGVPASATVSWRSGAPTRVDIDLPEGVRWSAVVVLST